MREVAAPRLEPRCNILHCFENFFFGRKSRKIYIFNFRHLSDNVKTVEIDRGRVVDILHPTNYQ